MTTIAHLVPGRARAGSLPAATGEGGGTDTSVPFQWAHMQTSCIGPCSLVCAPMAESPQSSIAHQTCAHAHLQPGSQGEPAALGQLLRDADGGARGRPVRCAPQRQAYRIEWVWVGVRQAGGQAAVTSHIESLGVGRGALISPAGRPSRSCICLMQP